jgi:nitrate/nitrite transporter NarK
MVDDGSRGGGIMKRRMIAAGIIGVIGGLGTGYTVHALTTSIYGFSPRVALIWTLVGIVVAVATTYLVDRNSN